MTRTLQLDHVTFEIFRDLDYRDEKGTLVAFVSDSDFANLRCSVHSVFRKGVEAREAAEREIPRLATEDGADYETSGEKFVYRTQKKNSEDQDSTMYYWYVGLGGHIAVLSVFVDHRYADDPRAKHVMDCAELLVRSFRRNENDA